MLKADQRLVDKIKERWLNLWHAKYSDGGDSHVHLWFQAITETMVAQGFEILPASLLSDEKSISACGLDAEYVDALVSVTGSTESNPMALVTATGEQRMKAVKIVRAYQNEKTETKGH